jgi:hypothetical protein
VNMCTKLQRVPRSHSPKRAPSWAFDFANEINDFLIGDVNAAQDKTSRAFHQAKANGVNGNPLSASSQRAQADTQRNVNQQTRIANGVKDGSLTHHEAAGLERGQSHVDAKEARAGANGHVSAGEQRRIARADNHQSARIQRQRHDAQVRG